MITYNFVSYILVSYLPVRRDIAYLLHNDLHIITFLI